MKKHALAIAMTAALLSGCAATSSSHNNTESTPYTLKSGGEIAPYQKGLSVSHARLNFSFDFTNEVLFGDTTLTLNSDSPQTHLSVDLDTRFTITSVWLNGKTLPATTTASPLRGKLKMAYLFLCLSTSVSTEK